jgi:hypothetical protein
MATDLGFPRVRPVNRLPFGVESIPVIAAELGVVAKPARFRVDDTPVWECRVPTRWLAGGHLHVILWPSLARVDARIIPFGAERTPIAVTAKGVHTVEVYDGVEVMFRRDGGSVLFVTRNGHMAVAD